MSLLPIRPAKSALRLGAILLPLSLAVSACAGGSGPASAQVMTAPAPTYADLVSMAEAAPIVVEVEIRDQAVLEPERAPGLQPGMARVYIESSTVNLLKGPSAVGGEFAFLADVPLNAKGKVSKMKEQRWLLFARPVAGNPGQLQLIDPEAYLPAIPTEVARTRAVIAELVDPAAPPVVTGVNEVITVEGNLAGESETQMFLSTRSDAPVSITVVRRPGMLPSWGVSWSEIVDQSARPPQRDTLEWYRLACGLPPALSSEAFLQGDAAARRMGQDDFAFVLEQLGPCNRTRAAS